MGKKIIWSTITGDQLDTIYEDILEVSKSERIAGGVLNDIVNSVSVLSKSPEIYTLDENKKNNDGTYRSFEIRTYNISYRILDDVIRIIRVRYSGREPKVY